MSRIAEMAAATPTSRDRYVDFLRLASLVGVMVGHFFLAVILIETAEDGSRVWITENLLNYAWWGRAGTWLLQVMPIFFVVGGFGHAVAWRSLRAKGAGYADFLRARVTRLVLPTLVFVTVGLAASIVLELTVEQTQILERALQIAGQLLWFIGIYLVAVAFAPTMLRLHERFGWGALAALGTVVVAVDVLRLGLDIDPVKWLNFGFVWLAVHQLGFFYADGVADRRGRKLGATMLGLGALACFLLIWFGPYGYSLISYEGETLSNLTPPTVVLLVFAVAQAGVLLLIRPGVTRWLDQPRVWRTVIAGGAVAMTAFLWHFVALMSMYGIAYAFSLDVFQYPGTAEWWLARPVLLATFLLLVAVFVLMFRWADRPSVLAELVGPSPWRTLLAALAAACAVAGMMAFAVVGFRGVLAGYAGTVAVVDATAWQAYVLVLASVVFAWAATRRLTPSSTLA